MKEKEEKDKWLLDKIRDGDISAMKDFYDSFSGYFTAVCYRYIVDKEDAKDVLQEIFVKIFKSIHQFEYRGAGSLKAWGSRIVVNECLRFLQSQTVFTNVPIDEVGDVVMEEPEMNDLPMSVIMEMIRNLPEGYRTVFNLFVFEEKSHKEIAKLLGIAENSSASQFHRAKKLLAKQVEVYRSKNK